MATISPAGIAPASILIPPLPPIRGIEPREFFDRFDHAKEIGADEIGVIDGTAEQGIFSKEMDAEIALFAVGRNAIGKIAHIIGFHMTPSMDQAFIDTQFADFPIMEDLQYEIFILGGNETSRGLTDLIHKAIPTSFTNPRIIEMLNLKDSEPNEFISAGIGMDGVVVFCQHRRLPLG